MFCSRCGKEIEDDAYICIHCGRLVNKEKKFDIYSESKTIFGFFLGLLGGIIGLLIGLMVFPKNSIARKTFVKGWVVGLIVAVLIIFVYVMFILLLAFLA